MSKITFTMDIEPEEVSDARDMLKDVVQAFGFPVYELGVKYEGGASSTEVGGTTRGVVELPPVGGRSLGEDLENFGSWVEAALPGWALDDEDEDDTDVFIVPGDVLELANGLVYQVFSTDANGRVILDQLEELDMTDEGEVLH